MSTRSRWRCCVGILFVALIFGHLPAAAVELQPPPQSEIPDLTGKWKGTWGGDMVHRTEMFVKDQDGTTISGTIIYFWRGKTYPNTITGTLGLNESGELTFVVKVTSESGTFTFTTVGPNRLEGKGSNISHRGPITLTRQ